jgi:hypothetical protein
MHREKHCIKGFTGYHINANRQKSYSASALSIIQNLKKFFDFSLKQGGREIFRTSASKR